MSWHYSEEVLFSWAHLLIFDERRLYQEQEVEEEETSLIVLSSKEPFVISRFLYSN